MYNTVDLKAFNRESWALKARTKKIKVEKIKTNSSTDVLPTIKQTAHRELIKIFLKILYKSEKWCYKNP